MKIKTASFIALGLLSLGAVIAWKTASGPAAPEIPTAAADRTTAVDGTVASQLPSAPEPAKAMALEEWLEKRASGDPSVPSAPPHIQTVLSSFGLPKEMWEEYASEPVEALEKRLGELKAEFATLRQKTGKLKEEHSKLARGSDPRQADAFMRDQVLPTFEVRNRLLGEALLVVNAKALATNGAPEMPAEMRVH